jgi:DNA-binding transcriptional LysR family regulator
MTDLNSLIMFAKVVEAHSFSEAARRLNMPISTVSRRIAELEGRARRPAARTFHAQAATH